MSAASAQSSSASYTVLLVCRMLLPLVLLLHGQEAGSIRPVVQQGSVT